LLLEIREESLTINGLYGCSMVTLIAKPSSEIASVRIRVISFALLFIRVFSLIALTDILTSNYVPKSFYSFGSPRELW